MLLRCGKNVNFRKLIRDAHFSHSDGHGIRLFTETKIETELNCQTTDVENPLVFPPWA